MNSGLNNLHIESPRKSDENLEAVMPPQPQEGISEAVVNVAIEKLDSDTFSVRQSGAFKLESILSRMNSPKDLHEFGALIEKNIEAFKETDTSPERTDRLRLLSKSLKDKVLNMIIEDVQKKDGEIKFGRSDHQDLSNKPDSTHPEIMSISYDPDRDPYLGILALHYTKDDFLKEHLLTNLENHVDTVEHALVKLMSTDTSGFSQKVFDLLAKSKNPEILTEVKDFIKNELKNSTVESFEKWRGVYIKFDIDAVFDICKEAMESNDLKFATSAETFLISNFDFTFNDTYRPRIIDLLKERNDIDTLASKLQYGSNDSEIDQKNRLEFLADQNIPVETRLSLLNGLGSWLANNYEADSQLRTVISALEIDDPVIVQNALAKLGSWVSLAEFVKERPYIKEKNLEYIETKKQEVNLIANSFLESSDNGILCEAITLYENINEGKAETKLSTFLAHESEEVRLIAASSILKHSDSSAAIEVLESILKSTDVNHRLEALEILVKKDNLTTAEVVESIITVSDNSTPLIEKKAKILGLIKSEQAVDLLIELKEKTNDTGTIAKIVDAIANQGAFAEKVLPQLKELEQKYQNSSYSFNFKSAVEKVTISLMHSGNPEYLLDSVEILSSKWGEDKMSPEESVKLISSVENSSQELIIRKASMLGRIGSEQSTELLFELLKLEDNSVTATVILLAIEKQESISKSQKSELDELINKYSDDNSILFLIHELKEKM